MRNEAKRLLLGSALAGAFLLGVVCSGFGQDGSEASLNPYLDDAVTSTSVPQVNPKASLVLPSSTENSAAEAPGAAQGSEYVVKAGDNLSAIARRLLGDPARFWEIVRLNLDQYPSLAKNPNLILVGWKLKIPGDGSMTQPVNSTLVPAPVPQTPTTSSGSQASTPALPSTSVAPATPAVPGEPLMNANSRVLHIGDSHTAGIYGHVMDDMMRGTGAKVETFGVAGSSPSWFLNRTTTRCGYFAKDASGKVDQPADWRTPRQAPDFRQLIKDFKPTVVVISLGANMLGASPSRIQSEVASLCEVAKAAGTTIVWIGPPNGREDKKPPAQQAALVSSLKAAVQPYGTFIDSSPITHYPSGGGDGVHFWGKEGTQIAQDWAKQAFQTAQTSGRK